MTSELRHICNSIADFALMSYTAIGRRYHDDYDDVPLKPTHPMGEGEEEGGMNESSLSIVNRALYYETTMTGITPISKSTARWAELEWKLKNHLEQIGDPGGSSPNVRSRRSQSDQGKTYAENLVVVPSGEGGPRTLRTTGIGWTRVRRNSASLIEEVLQEIGTTTTSKPPSSEEPRTPPPERRSEFVCPQDDDGHFGLRSHSHGHGHGASQQHFQAFSDDVDIFDDESFHCFWASASSRIDLPVSSRGHFEQILPPVNNYADDARPRNDTPPLPAVLLPAAAESSLNFCRPDFAPSPPPPSFHSPDGSAGARSTGSITFARLGSGCQIISCASNPAVCMTTGSMNNVPCLATPFHSSFLSTAETAFSRNTSTPSPSASMASLLSGAVLESPSPSSTILAHSDICIDVDAKPERASPLSVLAASGSSCSPSPAPKQKTYPGCSTIRYIRRRRNQNQAHDTGLEEDDKRRVHFCHYPGQLLSPSIVLPPKQIN